jgi:diguanylate cyclase (GGDEF)-like protein
VRTALNDIRTRFAAEKFSWGGTYVTITASFGIAGFLGKRAPEFAQLLSRADAALYRAKRLGRNRIEIDPLKFLLDGAVLSEMS